MSLKENDLYLEQKKEFQDEQEEKFARQHRYGWKHWQGKQKPKTKWNVIEHLMNKIELEQNDLALRINNLL